MIGNELLIGERIRLTPVLDEDVPLLAEWLSDMGLQRLVNPGIVTPFTAQDLLDPESWFMQDRNDKNSYVFAVRTKADDQFIGIGALNQFDTQARHAEFGINLAHPDYQNRGYGGEVTHLILRYGFRELNLNRIWLSVFSYNLRAIRLYKRIGFVHEATEREMLFRDGTYYDLIKMGMLRSEWETRDDHGE